MKHYLEAADKAARAAGKLLRKNFQQPQRVNAFSAHDIKLEIDVQAQKLITRLLLEEFPEHALYGEEGVVGDQSSEHQWIISMAFHIFASQSHYVSTTRSWLVLSTTPFVVKCGKDKRAKFQN